MFDIEKKIEITKREQKQVEEELEHINFSESYDFPIKEVAEYYNKHIKNKKKPKEACRMRNENELDIEPTRDCFQFTLLKEGIIKMNIDYEKLEDKLIFPKQCKSQLDKVGFFLESQRLYNKMENKLMYKSYINFETESKNLREFYNINVDDLYDNFVKFRREHEENERNERNIYS